MPRHIVLVTRDASLVVAVRALLDDSDLVSELESPQELPATGELPVDGIVVDLPTSLRAASVERVRGRFAGPLVVLLDHGEDAAAARRVYRCSVLSRPFGMSQLWSLLADSKTEVMPAIGREQAFPGTALAEGSPAVARRAPEARPAPQARPAAQARPVGEARPGADRPEVPAAGSVRPAPPPGQPGQPRPPGPPRPAVAPGRPAVQAGPARPQERIGPADPQPRPSETGARRADRADAPPGGPEAEPRKVPAWNWRSRRFQPAPVDSDQPGARTEQMPAVPPAGNGLPLRVERPPVPEGPPRHPGAGPAAPAAQAADAGARVSPVRGSPAGGDPASPLPDPPEAVAGRLAERLHADVVALLLDNNRGLLEVAGGVGLTTPERQAQIEYGHEVLRELFRVGVGLIEDTDRVRGLISGIPGARYQTLVMVPLVHEGHGFGALIIGRSDHPGQPRAEFTEPEIEALMDFAEDVAAPLRSTVLLRRLKGQLSSPEGG